MSANISSELMSQKSSTGLRLSLTCTISLSLKNRTTWAITSVLLIWLRNSLPSPSPLDAPFINPAISTNCIEVLTIFLDLLILANLSNLTSGTLTYAIFGSIVQNG